MNPSLKIKIVVTGLTSANHETIFTLPDTVDIDTIQTDPLEGRNLKRLTKARK